MDTLYPKKLRLCLYVELSRSSRTRKKKQRAYLTPFVFRI
ncbi:hypothetical protein POREN0001_1305 [Porphyromonas endodontalis ATCC 35406]|uniref:Uncharacterized protein n=1 Tax=Porphyromonas endodontalis (strain ATCC 35406 / DSM 24491 / JCM 8526 / CCUG 16442 / BCRC 14492 / NCTC 13058 / HG 370) TaxID=553175 RepID=C3J862_POREA|nr:hypothetical protein POREN0001_1305 [Porphyromonas endodontalis ATCC 35406]